MGQKKSQSWLPWVVWLFAAFFFGYQFCLRVSPSVMISGISNSFGVDACALGALSAFYYYGYSALQIPAGILLDRFGPRRVLMSAVLLCGGGALAFAFAPGVLLASVGRLLMGMGSAFAFLGCIKIGSVWFSPQKLSFVIGCSIFIGTAGAVGGGAPLSWAVEQMGWRQVMIMLSGIALGLFIMLFIFLKEKVTETDPTSASSKKLSLLADLWTILKNPQTWILGGYGIAMYVPLAVFGDLWGVPFLVETHHIEPTMAAFLISFLYIGIACASPFVSFMVPLLKSYRRCLFAGSACSTLLLTALLFQDSPTYILLGGLIFCVGIAVATQFLAFTVVCSVNPPHLSATASGVQNMICMCSGVVFQPVVGWLLDIYALNGERFYRLPLTIIPVSTALAGILSLYVREIYNQKSL